ncbi:MAG: flagellar hook capping protein [Lachnospiraceae bacterium]|nr:flagellar hook capping protein [Lachnospiraceae bacterium]
MADSLSVSGTSNPYVTQSYTAEANDRNTITMTGFFQLLATQLQNQDMTNPMDNSEIMNQMTQMAMVQSMTSMTDALKNVTTVNTQTYAAGLVGQEVTMAVTEENIYGVEEPVDVKYAKVEWVNFTSGNPTIKLEDDPKEYQLSHLVGMGRVPNPFKTEDAEGEDDEGDTDPVEGAGKPTDTDLEQDPEADLDMDLESENARTALI